MPYSFKLPHKFLIWWAIKSPLKIFKIGRIFLSVADNELSFLTNIKLLFVPLFGIYTIPGRLISFFARVFMIIFGMFFMIFLLILYTLLPLIWFGIPIAIGRHHTFFVILYFIVLYILWIVSNLNKPDKKISQVLTVDSQIKSFRPLTKSYLNVALKNSKTALKELLNNKDIVQLMKRAELDKDYVKKKLLESPNIKPGNLLEESFKIAQENKSRYVEIEHLFISIIQNIPNIDTVLSTFNSSSEMIKQTAFWIIEERERLSKVYIWQDDYDRPPSGGIGKGMLGRVTPKLDKVSFDITGEVKRGRIKNIVGREEEIKKIAEILDGEKNDIIIIGESGIGKTSIIKGIAYRIIAGTEYKTLKNKRIVSLDVGSLISGSGGAGNIAEKLSGILEEVEGSGDIILFIDEIQNLVTGMGEEGGQDSTIFSMLENHITKGKIRFIGATSISNYRKYIEPNEAIARLFQIIKIEESSKEDSIKILKELAVKIEKQHRVMVTYPAIQESIELSEKLIHDRVLPDKAIDIVERTATSIKNSTKYLTSEDIAKEISEMTSIPLASIEQDEAQKLLDIGSEMKKRVIGQDQAIDKIEMALQRARTGMRDENKPIASFLFVGTTGVGKTETAKALSASYFGDEKNMIRLDMSEYQQIDSLNRIIGTPDGSTAGTLTDSVRNKPFTLVLIDEIEKAHPNILLTFLQMLDEGRLTDTAGNEANFTNTIIISTSNVGTKSIQSISESGGSYEKMQESAMNDIRSEFAPELLNRFTGIVVFNPLSTENLRNITKLMLGRVRNVAEEKGIQIDFRPELIDELIKQGYSPQWGARPLARVIEDSVESFLAVKILKKEIKAGDRLMLGLEVFGI